MEGSAYLLPEPTHDTSMTEVERGTPMGELLRRYWHPVGLTADAGPTPKKVTILGEELILFRDGQGRVGLIYPRCCHRGTTLYYGKVEDDGIRCCYHGWQFDVEGRCLDMPVEPEGGGNFKRKVRQPWYPVEERYGLIFAYMGPPDKKPLLPRYAILEELDEGELVDADDSSLGSGGDVVAPCNWLQHFENVMDPFHVVVLHDGFSGTQFVEPMGIMPEVTYENFEHGVRSFQVRTLDDGRTLRRITETVLPTLRIVASPVLTPGRCGFIGWTLPVDSAHYRIYTAARVTKKGALVKNRSKPGGKLWFDMTEEEHQKYPGDWEAQVGQGPISYHSEEHLGVSDKGIIMLRKMFNEQLAAITAGEDPINTARTEDENYVTSQSGNWFEDVAAE
jgi:phenylpropionate dioxygenase-like ring-hydroxylating dioxygenase large terminal subunit